MHGKENVTVLPWIIVSLWKYVGYSILHTSCSIQISLVKSYFEHDFYILKGNDTVQWQDKMSCLTNT